MVVQKTTNIKPEMEESEKEMSYIKKEEQDERKQDQFKSDNTLEEKKKDYFSNSNDIGVLNSEKINNKRIVTATTEEEVIRPWNYILAKQNRAALYNALILLLGYILWYFSRVHFTAASATLREKGLFTVDNYGN